MPYISIKTYPKDDETKQKAAEAVPETTYETILRHFGTDA